MLNLKHKNNSAYTPAEYKQYSFLRIISFGIIFVAITSVCIGLYLIYQNIYLTIAKTQSSILFNPNLSQEIIDFGNYDNVKKSWEEKTSAQKVEITRDPFSATPTTTSSTIDKKA